MTDAYKNFMKKFFDIHVSFGVAVMFNETVEMGKFHVFYQGKSQSPTDGRIYSNIKYVLCTK